MRRLAVRALVALVAAGLLITGLSGAYDYGQSYSMHRGFVRLAHLKRAGAGRLLRVNFYSPALHRRAFYLVYLPSGYNPALRYPVYYLLHGMPGRPQAYVAIGNIDVRLDNLLSLSRVRPMILVFPDGRINGSTYSDSEWANTPAGNFDTYVIDVVKDVDHRFATLRNRQDRVIGGLSAGAYGAINVALHHVPTFGSLQVWSGYFRQTRTGVFTNASRAMLEYNSPLDYAPRLRHTLAVDPMRVFLLVGRGDPASRQIVPMARTLSSAGAAVSYAIYKGGHDWGVWYPRLNRLLMLASHDMSHPLRARPIAGARAIRVSGPIPRSRTTGPRSVARRHRHRTLGARTHRHRAVAPRRENVAQPRSVGPPPIVRQPRSVGPPHVHARKRHRSVIWGLLLALFSAAAISLGFLLQQRGLRESSQSAARPILAVLRNRQWLGGQAIGWIGMAAQVIAVAIAPLSLVQAFAIGGLAFSVPLAARIFGHRVSRKQVLSVLLIAAAVASLPIALPRGHEHLNNVVLIASVVAASLLAMDFALGIRAELRAIGAGLMYGVADAAIKAVAVGWHVHGSGALLSGWTVLALAATFGGFLAFQSALRTGNAVNAISLMTAITAITALGFGVLSFGESLGNTPASVLLHVTAILVALACTPLLVDAQQEMAGDAVSESVRSRDGSRTRGSDAILRRPPRALVLAAVRVALVMIVLPLSLLAGFGLLYRMRSLHWADSGVRLGDSLPLLQLARFDAQPLLRLAAAWLPAGMIFGLGLIRVPPLRRAVLAATFGTLLLVFASDAAFALARNLRLGSVLTSRVPGDGTWCEGILFVAGCWLVYPLARLRRARDPGITNIATGRYRLLTKHLAARAVGR